MRNSVVAVCGQYPLLVFLALVVPTVTWAADVPTDAKRTAHARTLYLVRHGSYSSDETADQQKGPGLTPLGVAQARLIAARLRGVPVHFDTLTSSTMTRAEQTAASVHDLLPDVPTSADASLSECMPPAFRDLGVPQAGQHACAERLDAEFAQRFTPALTSDANDIIVAHGNVIRYFVTKALKVDTRAWLGMSVAHASLTIVQVAADGSMSVLSVGDMGHIPPNLQSWAMGSDAQLIAPKHQPR